MPSRPGRSRNYPLIALVVAVLVVAGLLGLRWSRSHATRTTASASASVTHLAGSQRLGASPKRLREGVALRAPTAISDEQPGAATISGRVVDDATGQGIPRALLALIHAGQALSASAGDDGSFVFERLEPGTYELVEISADSFESFRAQQDQVPVELQARAGTRLADLVFTLSPIRTLSGLVVDASGKPVAGAEVHDLDGEHPAVTTDAQGTFKAPCRRGGILEARHPSFVPGRALCSDFARARASLTIQLRPPGAVESIAGRVVDADGNPVAGAELTAEPSSRSALRPSPLWRRVVSDENGAFAVDALAAGNYDVTATYQGLAPGTELGVAAGRRDLTLRLLDGASLRGLVRDQASGKPRVAFSILLTPIRGPLERGPAIARTFFAADGRFELAALTPGEYLVTAIAAGSAPAPERRFTLADHGHEDVVFDLASGGSVHGVVVDATKRSPVSGAFVSVETQLADTSSAVPIATSSTTDESGRFELSGLGTEPFSIMVTSAAHHSRIQGGLRVAAGGALGPLSIELTPTAPGEAPHLELAGIGAVVEPRGDALAIGTLLPGGGALEVGLKPGDAIVAVEGTPVTDIGFGPAIQRIRGPEGTFVTLTIRRSEGNVTLAVPRRRVRTKQ